MFTPLITPGEPLHDPVVARIHEIAAAMQQDDSAAARTDIYGGTPGIALIFAWLGRIFPEKEYSDHAYELLNQLIDDLGAIQWSPDMGRELAGAAFALQHLQNTGIIDEEDDLGLDAVDEFLQDCLPLYAEYKNWDPLLGIVPVGLYFLERYKKTGDTATLETIAGHIIGMAAKYNGYDVWITAGHRYQPKDCLNFGMAHGMPGLVSFLAQVYAAGVKKDELKPVLDSCVGFLLSCQNDPDKHSLFPSYLFPDEEDEREHISRLGWCYGDLGMAFALLHWGQASGQPALVKKATDIALATTSRSFEHVACTDAPFCHGSAGLLHQYNRLYQLTKEPALKAAALQWVEQTLDHYYSPGQGAGGYPFMTYDETDGSIKPVSNISLLEGAGGVALTLATALSGFTPSWDAIFLTNVGVN